MEELTFREIRLSSIVQKGGMNRIVEFIKMVAMVVAILAMAWLWIVMGWAICG